MLDFCAFDFAWPCKVSVSLISQRLIYLLHARTLSVQCQLVVPITLQEYPRKQFARHLA